MRDDALEKLSNTERRLLVRRLNERRAWLVRRYATLREAADKSRDRILADSLVRDCALVHYAIRELEGLRDEILRMIR